MTDKPPSAGEAPPTAAFPVSAVNRVKRTPDRGRYDKADVYAILDAALVCHIAYVVDGRPFCTPTSFWREGDHVYWHGSSKSRMTQTQARGVEVCLTVTHLDALVMARSGFHHAVNYRAAMVFGRTHLIADRDEKLRLMNAFIDRVYPGRSRLVRPPNAQEIKATSFIGLPIEMASGKIRDKHVSDDEEDYAAVPAWSALYPISQVLGPASECSRQLPGLERPGEMAGFQSGVRLDTLMTRTYARTFEDEVDSRPS